jgi:hypothetical protein
MRLDGKSSLGDVTCKKTSSTIACELRCGLKVYSWVQPLISSNSQRIARATKNREASKERNLRANQALREFHEAS